MFHIKLCRLAKERLKQVGSAGMTVTEKASTVHHIIKKAEHVDCAAGLNRGARPSQASESCDVGVKHTVHDEECSDGRI